MKRNHLSLAIGLTLSLAALQATAQEAAPAQAAQDEELATLDAVEVTARRRSESIQDVPVAVSAFGEDQLRDLQATNIDGIQGAVPNMNIVQGRGSSNSANVFIRGIGQPDALQTFDPGVGMYVDDVYFSRINGALFNLFDVQQVEVLRGPQGTLYGKNSTGGAIKITTREPAEETEGALEFTLGEFGRRDVKGYVAGQVGEGVGASFAILKADADGYVTDPLTGREYNGEDTTAARFKLSFTGIEDLRITLTADHLQQKAPLTLGRPEADLRQTDLGLGTVVLRPRDPSEYNFESSTSFAPFQGQELEHEGITGTVAWDISERWSFKSITAFRRLQTNSYIDIDASEYELGDVLVALDQDQRSQEFQFFYDNGSNFTATFGAYYLKEDVPSYQEAYADDLFALGGAPISFLRTIEDDLRTTSTAAFVHTTWEFAPTWTLASGVRWTRDQKDYDRSTSTFWGAPFSGLNGTVAFSASDSWTAVTPSVSLQKAFSDQLMGYVSANRGFKSGGFNGRANSAAEAADPAFDPEFVWTYEAGLKFSSADNRFRGAATAFVSDYTDFQARVSQDVGTFPVLNAAELDIMGLELEVVMMLGDATTISGQVSWLDAEYGRFEDFRLDPSYPGYDPNVNHDHVPFSPEWTARIGIQHVFSLGDAGNITVGGDASYRDDTWLSVDNRDVLKQDAHTLVGLYAVWDSADYRWQLRGGVRNLTDEVYKTDAQEFASVGNIQTAYYGAPRNYYVSLRYNF